MVEAVSASRDKGARLEKWWAQRIHAVDGKDPLWERVETPTGRVGNTYHLQTDVISRTTTAECKARESIGSYLWSWLDQVGSVKAGQGKTPILVLRRNRRRALVVLDAEDFLTILGQRVSD
jgi:hypothetical protein